MKTIQLKPNNFQTIYASGFMTAIFVIAVVEIYLLGLAICGGAR